MKSFIQINGKQIKISEETVEELEKQFSPKKGLWKPEPGEKYYFIHNDGCIGTNSWEDDEGDNKLVAIGNVFRTRELAEQEIAKRKAIQSVKIYITENFGMFIPVWRDFKQEKWLLDYDYEDKKFISVYGNFTKYYSPFGYLKSKKDCDQLIADMEAKLSIIFDL